MEALGGQWFSSQSIAGLAFSSWDAGGLGSLSGVAYFLYILSQCEDHGKS